VIEHKFSLNLPLPVNKLLLQYLHPRQAGRALTNRSTARIMLRQVNLAALSRIARRHPPICIGCITSSIRSYSNANSPDEQKRRSDSIQFPEYNKKTYGADVKLFSQLPQNFGANQHMSIDDTLKETLRSVLWKFNAPIRYAFAYGSGVFQQANSDPKAVNFSCE